MVRIHPGQPNKQKRPIERSAFSVCLGVCPGASRPDPTPCAARCGRQPSPATSPRLTARPLVLQGGCFTRKKRGAARWSIEGHPSDGPGCSRCEPSPRKRQKPGRSRAFAYLPGGIPKDPTPGAMDQRLENWVARRALCRPTFLRSTSRASRVMKPALRSSDFRVSSYSISARAMPRRIAPA